MSIFEIFPGRACVTPAEAGAAVFGWRPATVYDHLLRGTFPLPLISVGKKRVVRVGDIAAALGEAQPAPAVVAPTSSRRRPGRPRKMEVQSYV